MGREAALEARCCTLARGSGCYPIKLGGFVVGLPDRALLLPGGGVWLVEFKSPEGRLSLAQLHLFSRLMRMGHPVEIVRDFEIFRRQLALKLA